MSPVDSSLQSEFLSLLVQRLVVQRLKNENVADICTVVSAMLAYYDFFITFADEVKCIWKRKFSFPTFLFMMNRYSTLFSRTLLIIQLLPYQYTTLNNWQDIMLCTVVLRSSEAFTVVSQVSVAIFLALRTFAIWRRDWRIFVLVFALGMIVPITSIYYFATLTPTIVGLPFIGCSELASLSDVTIGRFNIAVRLSAIVADAVVLILTWMKTMGMIRDCKGPRSHRSVVLMLLRDGTVYFAALLILNIANVVAIQSQAFGSNGTPAFNDVVVSIIVSRFLLNLREIGCSATSSNDSSAFESNGSDVYFVKGAVINIGAPLYSFLEEPHCDHGWDEELSSSGNVGHSSAKISTSPGASDGSVAIYDGDNDGIYFVVELSSDSSV